MQRGQPGVAATGYAPVNGLTMYYEIHGSGRGEPLVLLHGSYMTISSNWTEWIGELSKTRKVIAVEMQGHGRTADINRDFSYENLADDIAAMLDHLKIKQADLLGYSMGGGVAMQVAIRHPDKVRRVVSISAVFRHDGWVKEALDMFPQLTADIFKGSPIETEYKKLSPTPNEFPNFVKRVIAMDLSHTISEPIDSRPPRPRFFSYTATPTASDWTTSLKCSASRAMRFLATCGRARNPGWPFYRTRHTLR